MTPTSLPPSAGARAGEPREQRPRRVLAARRIERAVGPVGHPHARDPRGELAGQRHDGVGHQAVGLGAFADPGNADGHSSSACGVPDAGSVTVTVVPTPTVLSIRSVPPWRSTIP